MQLNIKEDLFRVFGSLMQNNQANKLLKLIKDSFNDEETKEIFIYFLENISSYKLNLNYRFHENIIDYFFKDKNYPLIIPVILANQEIKKCQTIRDYILDKLNSKIISDNEFYSLYFNFNTRSRNIENSSKVIPINSFVVTNDCNGFIYGYTISICVICS